MTYLHALKQLLIALKEVKGISLEKSHNHYTLSYSRVWEGQKFNFDLFINDFLEDVKNLNKMPSLNNVVYLPSHTYHFSFMNEHAVVNKFVTQLVKINASIEDVLNIIKLTQNTPLVFVYVLNEYINQKLPLNALLQFLSHPINYNLSATPDFHFELVMNKVGALIENFPQNKDAIKNSLIKHINVSTINILLETYIKEYKKWFNTQGINEFLTSIDESVISLEVFAPVSHSFSLFKLDYSSIFAKYNFLNIKNIEESVAIIIENMSKCDVNFPKAYTVTKKPEDTYQLILIDTSITYASEKVAYLINLCLEQRYKEDKNLNLMKKALLCVNLEFSLGQKIINSVKISKI